MGERRCLYCQQNFQPSKFQRRQAVCGEADCQRRRRADYHRAKLAADPEYRDVCRDSPRKWRSCNPDYWKQYRQKNPASADRNRELQQLRDRKRRLRNLANKQLNLNAISRQIETTIADAAARNLSVSATLELLADMELESRNGRAIERRFKSSRLQTQASIDAFHFHHHKSRVQAKNRILRLLDLAFLRQGTNLVLIGNPGVGKTFLARVIGSKACQANQRVLFTTAMDMLNHLLASQVDHSLVRKLKIYTDPTLVIVDELGYLSLDQQTSNLFYQVISTRHSQKRSTIITTNTPFSDWGNILFNTTIATAIADRLVENSEIFLLGGESLRKTIRNSAPPEE